MKSYIFYAVGKGIPGLAFFLITPIWLRIFGSQEYGIYAITWSLSLVVSGFFVGWIRQSTLQFTGINGHDYKYFPGWVMPIVYFLVFIITASICLLLNTDQGNQTPLLTSLFASGLAISSAKYLLLQVITQRDENALRYNLAEGLRAVTTIAFSMLALIYTPLADANFLLVSLTLGNLVAIIALYKRRSQQKSTVDTHLLLKKFWDYGWPMGLWLSLAALLVYSDRILLGILADETAVGEYSAISDIIVRGYSLMAMPLTLAAHPKIMKLSNLGMSKDSAKTISKNMYIITISGLLFVLIISIIQSFIYGYLGLTQDTYFVMPVLATGAVLWQLALIGHKPFEVRGESKTLLVFLILSLGLSVTSNLMLIPVLGMLGCAVSFTAGALFYVFATQFTLLLRVKKLGKINE